MSALRRVLLVTLLLWLPPNALAIEVYSCDSKECATQFKKYKKFAKNGSADAQEILANLYLNGYGTKVKPSLAIKWFKKASGQGKYGATASLAYMYLQGRGTEKDTNKGLQLLSNLANKGVSNAALQLGVLYAQGEFVDQDYKMSEQWLRNAIAAGNPQAAFILASLYEEGLTGTVKVEDAKLLYQHAAKSVPEAAERLAQLGSGQAIRQERPRTNEVDENIERIEIVATIGNFLNENLSIIKNLGIYNSSGTGSRLNGKSCSDNANCMAAVNPQDTFKTMNVWNRMNPVQLYIRAPSGL
ncbi:MAG: hypothetical protein ACI9LM_001981 [Alteromonadaceae bacterium]|jgi:hypothetical protein